MKTQYCILCLLRDGDILLILGIETSCDETSVAVVKDGREVLSDVISSQIDIHTQFGGVVPEIASRKHLEAINGVIDNALEKAGVTLDDIDAIGVTYGFGSEQELSRYPHIALISDISHIVNILQQE